MVNGANPRFKKVVALILIGVWGTLILGLAPREPSQFLTVGLTAFVFLLVGRMWGIEAGFFDRFRPITIDWGNDE